MTTGGTGGGRDRAGRCHNIPSEERTHDHRAGGRRGYQGGMHGPPSPVPRAVSLASRAWNNNVTASTLTPFITPPQAISSEVIWRASLGRSPQALNKGSALLVGLQIALEDPEQYIV